MSIDFNELRLVRKYGSWINVMDQFNYFARMWMSRSVQIPTPEAAWAAFLKEEDESE